MLGWPSTFNGWKGDDAVISAWYNERGRGVETCSLLAMGEEEQGYMWCVVGCDFYGCSCLVVRALLVVMVCSNNR